MEERDLKNNYIFALVKLFLFLLIFCFLTETVRSFFQNFQSAKGLSLTTFIAAVIASFSFYIFFFDLNGFYSRLQKFFFRSKFFSCLIPSGLILFAVSYFFLPRIFGFSINQEVFLFSGTFALMAHLIYISKITRGNSFVSIANYLFIFSIFLFLNLILFGFYLKVNFNFNLGSVLLAGAQNGTDLIRDIFVCSFRQ